MKLGLIGKSLGHSFSKTYFEQKFKSLQIEGIYSNYELGSIEEVNSLFLKESLDGFNVTIPYKVQIIPFLDELSVEAQAIGAVNTVKIIGEKKIGYNTDAFGFRQLIKPFLTNHHERALIIGTGGASKAVSYVLESLGVNCIYLSRKPQGTNQFGYDDMNQNMIRFNKLIINTTPLGTFPNVDNCPPISFDGLTAEHLCIDLIYNPQKTKFLAKSEEKGAMIINGETMLHQQAEKAWEIWNG